MKSSMTPTSNTRLMNYYGFNVYGDPSVSISESICATHLDKSWWSHDIEALRNNGQPGRRHVFMKGGDNALWDNVDGSGLSEF